MVAMENIAPLPAAWAQYKEFSSKPQKTTHKAVLGHKTAQSCSLPGEWLIFFSPLSTFTFFAVANSSSTTLHPLLLNTKLIHPLLMVNIPLHLRRNSHECVFKGCKFVVLTVRSQCITHHGCYNLLPPPPYTHTTKIASGKHPQISI